MYVAGEIVVGQAGPEAGQGDAAADGKESSLDEATTTSAGPQQSRRCEVGCLREWWEGTAVTTSQRAEE